MVTQPARSPDLNHLDLSFFRALQSEQWKRGVAKDVDGLIEQVEGAFADFDPRKIEKGFLTIQTVCDKILKCHGDNTYKIPHIGKDKILRREGALPVQLEASEEAKEAAKYYSNLEDEVEEEELATLLQQWDGEDDARRAAV